MSLRKNKNKPLLHYSDLLVLEMCIVNLGIDLASRESNSCLKWSMLEYHRAYGYELIEIKLKWL